MRFKTLLSPLVSSLLPPPHPSIQTFVLMPFSRRGPSYSEKKTALQKKKKKKPPSHDRECKSVPAEQSNSAAWTLYTAGLHQSCMAIVHVYRHDLSKKKSPISSKSITLFVYLM